MEKNHFTLVNGIWRAKKKITGAEQLWIDGHTDSSRASSIDFMDLTELYQNCAIMNTDVQELNFKNIQTVHGYIQITNNNSLEKLLFPNLRKVGSYLSFRYNSKLQEVNLRGIEEIGGHLLLPKHIQKFSFDPGLKLGGSVYTGDTVNEYLTKKFKGEK